MSMGTIGCNRGFCRRYYQDPFLHNLLSRGIQVQALGSAGFRVHRDYRVSGIGSMGYMGFGASG